MTEEENEDSYCKECEACGHEGCCSATKCKQTPSGLYCDYYKALLKSTYVLHNEFVNVMLDGSDRTKKISLLYTMRC